MRTAPRLLRYLRGATRDATLAYAEAPQPLSGGFETAIFGFRLKDAPLPFAGPLPLGPAIRAGLRAFARTLLRAYRAARGRSTRRAYAISRSIAACASSSGSANAASPLIR